MERVTLLKIIRMLLEDPNSRTELLDVFRMLESKLKVEPQRDKLLEILQDVDPQLSYLTIIKLTQPLRRDPSVYPVLRAAYFALLGEQYKGNISKFTRENDLDRNTVRKHLEILGILEDIAAYRGKMGRGQE